MPFQSKLLLASTVLPYLRFLRDTEDPEAAQARVWESTWYEIRFAPFWRERLGASPRSAPPLRLFDLTDYETYRGAIESSFGTGISQLSGRPVQFWAESGGTTGKPKLFPLTEHYRRQFQATTPPLLHSLAQRFPALLSEPVLYFVETMPTRRSPRGIDVGYISNFNYRKIPPYLQRFYAFPLEVLSDAATFSAWGPLYALATDLSAIFAITPATILQLAQQIRAERDRYLACLEGQASPPPGLPRVCASRERLLRLRRALFADTIDFKELWPSLAFVCCWKSAACGIQLGALEPHLAGVPVTDATYSATEGWVNVPLETTGAGGPVHPGAHVFEFLPVGAEARKENLLPLTALESGQEYEIVLTTSMGLIRYRLYDVVRCTGFFRRTPCIAFSQKATSEVSLGLTRVSEAQLVAALERAGARPEGRYFFAPSAGCDGLVLYLEREQQAIVERLGAAESALRELNKYYRSDVDAGLLRPLGHQVLPSESPELSSAERAQQKPRLLRQSPPKVAT